MVLHRQWSDVRGLFRTPGTGRGGSSAPSGRHGTPALRMGRVLLAGLLSAFLTACATPSDPASLALSQLSAALWMQGAAEYKAATLQAYRTASSLLAGAVRDRSWTAIETVTGDYRNKPPAVILDVDETVLSNLPFEAWLIREDRPFDVPAWEAWCRLGAAAPVAGAVDYVRQAVALGIHVFYVTNRSRSVADATHQNLSRVGLVPDPARATLFFREGEADFGGFSGDTGKERRRRHIERDYRVVQLVGDSLGDFVGSGDVALAQRQELVSANPERWGRYWFVLPNPVYGAWRSALVGYQRLPSAEQLSTELDILAPMRFEIDEGRRASAQKTSVSQ